MKRIGIIFTVLATVLAMTFCISMSVFAADSDLATTDENPAQTTAAEEGDDGEGKTTSTKAIAAAGTVGLAAAIGAVSMGIVISKSAESMARQPEAASKINSAMMLGLVFIETLIIYALIVAILIIFVL